MLSEAEIARLVDHIVERIQPQEVIVFGSYAKGTATSGSDLDLFVIQETELPMADRVEALRPLPSHALVAVDLHVYTPEEVEAYRNDRFSFVHSVLHSGRVAFSRETDPSPGETAARGE